MRVCVVVFGFNKFGGLEDIVKNLSVAIHHRGIQVSVLATHHWMPPDNQYLRTLRENNIPFVQWPKWFSDLTYNWAAKEKLAAGVMRVLSPLVFLLAIFKFLLKRESWDKTLLSSRNWLHDQILNRIIGPDRRVSTAKILLAWWRFLWRPDVLHIHGFTANNNLLFVIDWAYKHKIPVVYEEHTTPDSQFNWWKDYNKSINKASRIIAVSKKSAEGLRDFCGVTQPITVVYSMVLDPVDDGWVQKSRSAEENDAIHITTPARLDTPKGLTYLLDAIVKVREHHPSAQFKVYGDGPLRAELLEYANRMGLKGEEIFAGAYVGRRDLSRIMAQTDIFVLSSVLEGLPITLLEAISYGCSVVATTVGGIPEVIENNVNGLLCAPGDPDCLAQNICKLIEDPGLRIKLGLAARETYERGLFNPVTVCNKFLTIYQDVLTENRQSHS